MRPNKLIIHHSLTADSGTVSWDAIRNYHVNELGWRDIGYHFGLENINGRNEILVGRMMDEAGAHTVGHNTDSLGICVVGNFDIQVVPEEQMSLLVRLSKSLLGVFSLSWEDVKRHSDYASYKSCPGKLFQWDEFISRIR